MKCSLGISNFLEEISSLYYSVFLYFFALIAEEGYLISSSYLPNSRMEKTRDLFKEIKDNKGTFHAKMGSIKDRNSMDLTGAEDIKRGSKNTQKNYTKKIFMTQIITMM